jgi:HK97 family phage prohead protease
MTQVRGHVRSLVCPDLRVKASSDGAVRIVGLANTPKLDRMKEVIEIGAFTRTLDIFATNPIMLAQHDPNRPIGYFDELTITPGGLLVRGVVVSGTPAADQAQALIKQGVWRTFSIGFRELDGFYDEAETYHITDLELLEISLVSIPANRESLFGIEGGKLLSVTLLDEDANDARDADREARSRSQTVERLRRAVLDVATKILRRVDPPSADVRAARSRRLEAWVRDLVARHGDEAALSIVRAKLAEARQRGRVVLPDSKDAA